MAKSRAESSLSDEQWARKMILKGLRHKFSSKRRQIMQQLSHDHSCQLCKKKQEKLDLHHILPLRELCDMDKAKHYLCADASNLILLCKECHQSWHKCFENEITWDQYCQIDRQHAWQQLKAYRNTRQKKKDEERRRRNLRWQLEMA